MTHNFQIKSLQDQEFAHFFELTNHELDKLGIVRSTVDKKPGYPCRVSLEDAEVGEEVLLLTYQHHKTVSPYQSSGPIFVRKNAVRAMLGINVVPKMLEHRLLSIRGYNDSGIMKEASVSEGHDLKDILIKIFHNQEINYVHIHNAKAGCYNCVAERVY